MACRCRHVQRFARRGNLNNGFTSLSIVAHGAICSGLCDLAGHGAVNIVGDNDRLDYSLDGLEACRICTACDWWVGWLAGAACVFGA